MHGNQVPIIELSFINNLTREVEGLQQEEYMCGNCRENKYFLIRYPKLGTTARLPKFGSVKSCPKKRG